MNARGQDVSIATADAGFSWDSEVVDAGNFAHLRVSSEGGPGRMAHISRTRICLSEETAADLIRVCRGTAFLTWTALVAGAALYLGRYARTDSVAIAVPARKDPTAIGPDAILPALLQLKGDETFRGFLQSCRTQLSALHTKPTCSAKRLLEAGFNAPKSCCPLQIGLAYTGLHSLLPDDAADIRINFEQQSNGICANAAFNNSLFTTQAINDFLAGQFELLRQGLSRPDLRCTELSLAPPERAKELYVSTTLQEKIGSREDFVDLFERIASQQPGTIAVRENEKTVSYRELDRRADELAQLLISHGTRNEEVVGVAMNRTITSIVAILGIWKAGAAYLPCDPDLPFARLSQILLDSGTRLVLTDRDLAFPPGYGVTVIDTQPSRVATGPVAPAGLSHANPDRLAYVIYTSGSTGNPKGVLLSHRGLAGMVYAQRQIFSAEECRNVLQFSAHSFDASIFDITMALGHGGTLHMSGNHPIPVGEQLFAVLHGQEITLATIPPCVVATLPEGDLPNLRALVVAGEACPQVLADRWSTRVRFVNAYGPTETTVWATYEQCAPGSHITMGTAIPGCRTQVLDQHLQPLPPGCPGELCLSGENLARGFVGLPAMTALHFVPDSLATMPGDRLYRTGDLVVLGCDGRIEFLGRDDGQNKIRGHRIELGDITAALARHPQLEQATTIVKDGPGDSKTIVAYAVARRDSQLTLAGLRQFVSDQLPEYMVPSEIVLVDRMPLTRSGKVNRRALLQLASDAQPVSAGGAGKPETEIEEVLTKIWAELLKRAQVGPEENFFQLGGHSLIAIQIVSRVKSLFGVRLPARAVFDAPTVREIGKRVEEGRIATRTAAVLAGPAASSSSVG